MLLGILLCQLGTLTVLAQEPLPEIMVEPQPIPVEPAPAIDPTAARWSIRPTLGLAATTRNLVLAGRLNYGRVLGPQFSFSLGGDYLLSGLISGFLLDDIASPRFVSSQVFGWVFPFPGKSVRSMSPAEHRRRPRIVVAAGVWETLEFDSLLQSARTEDFGVYQAYSLGGRAGLAFQYVSFAFGLKPFGAAQYTLAGKEYPTAFQFQNAVLDVDITLDLAELWVAGKRK